MAVWRSAKPLSRRCTMPYVCRTTISPCFVGDDRILRRSHQKVHKQPQPCRGPTQFPPSQEVGSLNWLASQRTGCFCIPRCAIC